ncbi:MAG: cysteine-rich CWC family protein [Xanthobacteraceae bacterium]
MENAERRLICESCGQEFGCRRDNISECWCNAEPYRLPMPVAGAQASADDCLCPACLRAARETVDAARRRQAALTIPPALLHPPLSIGSS